MGATAMVVLSGRHHFSCPFSALVKQQAAKSANPGQRWNRSPVRFTRAPPQYFELRTIHGARMFHRNKYTEEVLLCPALLARLLFSSCCYQPRC